MGNSYLKVVFSYSKCSFQNAKFCLMEIFQRLNYLNKYSLLNKIANVVSVIFCHNLLKLCILVDLSSVVLSTVVSNLEKLCICASGCQTISGNASMKTLMSLICGTSLECVTSLLCIDMGLILQQMTMTTFQHAATLSVKLHVPKNLGNSSSVFPHESTK